MENIKAYIKEIRKIPLLTAKEEVELSRKARKGDKDAHDGEDQCGPEGRSVTSKGVFCHTGDNAAYYGSEAVCTEHDTVFLRVSVEAKEGCRACGKVRLRPSGTPQAESRSRQPPAPAARLQGLRSHRRGAQTTQTKQKGP